MQMHTQARQNRVPTMVIPNLGSLVNTHADVSRLLHFTTISFLLFYFARHPLPYRQGRGPTQSTVLKQYTAEGTWAGT